MRRVRRLMLSLLLATPLAHADAPKPEYELTATGHLEIGPEGTVRDLDLDDGLPRAVRELIESSVGAWRFEPILVDGRAVIARTRLSLELVAQPIDADGYRVELRDARFGSAQLRGKIKPPSYPQSALRAGLGARVLLQVKLGTQGEVLAVHPYQTSLSKDGNQRTVERFRERFERASIAAVSRWQFDPAEVVNGEATGMTVIVPITFTLGERGDRDNRWLRFLPGPITPAPWVDARSLAAQSTDLLDDGESAAMDSRFKLLSDVQGKTL